MNKNRRGKTAEFMARMYMRLTGYKIIRQNYVTGRGSTAGEVDFIACRGKTLVFVEVKERQTPESAAYAILPRQQKRICNAARYFVQKNPQYRAYDIRFDALLVSFPFYLRHIQSAWRP